MGEEKHKQRSPTGWPSLWVLIWCLLLGILVLCANRRTLAQGPKAGMVSRVQQLIRRGALREARKELNHAIEAYPKAAELFDLLGIVEAQQGDLAAAAANFKKSIKLDAHLVGAYLNLGHIYQQQIGRDKTAAPHAIAVYTRLLGIDPENVEANFQLALLKEQQGDYRSSLAHLERLPAESRKSPRVLLIRLADDAALGQRASAERIATMLHADTSVDEADVLAVLPALDTTRTRHFAIQLLESLERRGRASSGALYQLAMLYQESGQLGKARSLLDRVARSEPSSVPVLLQLARIAEQQKEYKSALGYLAHARDLAPDDAAVHFFFGVVCVEENLGQEAYDSLKKAVELAPGNPYYNYALGAVILARDDTHPAIQCFQRYCKAKPDDPRGEFALGVAYFYSHDLKSAKSHLEAVTQFQQTAPGAHYFLGRIADLEGRLDQAVAELAQSLRERPGYADALTELGIVRMKQKKYDEAAKLLQTALKNEPNDYRANLNLMVLYERTHNPRAAIQRKRFEALKKSRAKTAKQFLRTIKVERTALKSDRH